MLSKTRLTADATNPPTTSSSVVLVNADTEIYVAPRPRNATTTAEAPKVVTPAPEERAKPPPGAKDATTTLRVVPARVGSKWGVPILSHDDSQVVGTENVAWVAPSTLARVRRRLGQAVEAEPLFVSFRSEEEPKEEKPEEEVTEEEDEPPYEAWLAGWDDMPSGCVVLAGDVPAAWSAWATAK